MDKKKSINNIQDLGLSIASRQSIGRQLIPIVYFKKKFILRKISFIFSNFLLFLEFFSAEGIGQKPIH